MQMKTNMKMRIFRIVLIKSEYNKNKVKIKSKSK